MARRKAAPLLTETEGAEPPRVAEVAAVADRAERQRLLSAILRDGKASGAEAVAAARLLEAMDQRAGAEGQIGLPPPTSRAEQTMRLVRIITASGPRMLGEALEIVAQRYERARSVALQNRKDGKLFEVKDVHPYMRRLMPREGKYADREGKRLEHDSSGASAAESDGLPELPGTEESVGPLADADERDGSGIGDTAEEVGERS